MNRAAKKKKKTTSTPPVAYLQVKFKDNENPKAFHIYNFGLGLDKIENYLKTVRGKWDWALLRQAKTNNIFYYYHPNTGTKRLDQKAYKKQLEFFMLYIIPTSKYKNRHGSQKGISKRVQNLDEVPAYMNKDVLRINVYQRGELINCYERGKFQKPR